MITNHDCKGALRDKGQKLIDAALEFWEERRKAGIGAAVVWLKTTDGKLVVFTRGEYQNQLMLNIDNLYRSEEVLLLPDPAGA